MQITRKNYDKITNHLIDISKKASEEVLKIYNSNFDFSKKKDNSPITIADEISNNLIIEFLKTNFGETSIISEENTLNKLNTNNFFLVDPLDGTKEFINKNGEFTINIAYMEKSRPCLGVIFIPAKNICYFTDGVESFKIENNKTKKIICNENPNNYKILVSRSHLDDKTRKIIKSFEKENILERGSSLKFCLIAEGIADIYFRFGNTMEWDIAAGHAILKNANGRVADEEYIEIKYGKRNFKNNSFIAYSRASEEKLKSFL